jgi:uncharacterized protein (DUF885 family)
VSRTLLAGLLLAGCAAWLGAASAVRAAVPPDLVDSERRLAAFPATRGEGSESERLRRLFDLSWLTFLRGDPEYATYVGVPGFDDRLGDFSDETVEISRRIARAKRAAFASIDRARLTPTEQVDYDLAVLHLEQQSAGERFHGEYLLVHQLSGVQQELPELLASMPERTARDFENRLARLRQVPALIDQTLVLLARGLEKGITPPRITLRDVPDQFASLLTDDPLKSPVLETFGQIPATVPAAERERLRGEASRLFREQVAPALRKLHDYLVHTYIPGARESIAMSDLPDGRAWYVYTVKTQTSTDLTPEQIHRLGLSEVKRIRGEMDALIAATGFQGSFADFCKFLRTDPRFFYDRPEDLITGYRDIAKRIDPELVKLFGRLPRLPYGVRAVPQSAARSQTTGYYGNGSLAAGQPGWFYVNTYDLKSRPKWEMEALASHESVPGHHIMYALIEELGELPDWRKWDVYPAMSEGWALYAESLGGEIGLYRDPYSKFGQLTYEMWRAIRLVVDTGLHTMGWSRQQAIDYARANSARTDHDIEVEIDRYIVWPGGAVVYKIGELKIKELRAYAEQELGPGFDLRAFHDQILAHGQLPLALLEKNVKNWVAAAKPSVSRAVDSAGVAVP